MRFISTILIRHCLSFVFGFKLVRQKSSHYHLSRQIKSIFVSSDPISNMASGPVTTPNGQELIPTFWYCHVCGYGPHNPDLFERCGNSECQHALCTSCRWDYVRAGSLQSEGHDDDRLSLSESGNLQSNSAICKSSARQHNKFASRQSLARVVAVGTTSTSPQPTTADTDGLSCDVIAHPRPVPPPEHSPNAISSQLADGTVLWNCCQCPEGIYLFAINLHCSSCGHYRCTNCYIYEVD